MPKSLFFFCTPIIFLSLSLGAMWLPQGHPRRESRAGWSFVEGRHLDNCAANLKSAGSSTGGEPWRKWVLAQLVEHNGAIYGLLSGEVAFRTFYELVKNDQFRSQSSLELRFVRGGYSTFEFRVHEASGVQVGYMDSGRFTLAHMKDLGIVRLTLKNDSARRWLQSEPRVLSVVVEFELSTARLRDIKVKIESRRGWGLFSEQSHHVEFSGGSIDETVR